MVLVKRSVAEGASPVMAVLRVGRDRPVVTAVTDDAGLSHGSSILYTNNNMINKGIKDQRDGWSSTIGCCAESLGISGSVS